VGLFVTRFLATSCENFGTEREMGRQSDPLRASGLPGLLGPTGRRWVYALAVVSPIVAVGLRLLFAEIFAPKFLLPVVVVMVSAILGGLGPGLVATVMSAVLVYITLFDPVFTIYLARPTDLVSLFVFVAVGCAVSVVADRRRRAELQASRRTEELRKALGEKAQAEQIIRDRESRLRAYFESPTIGIAITSTEEGLVEVNERFCSMLGYSREELARKTWQALTHPDDLGAELAHVKRVVAGEIDRYVIDKRVLRKDGSTLWVLLSINVVRRADGNIDYTVAMLQDITERRGSMEALAASERRYRETQAWLLESQKIARIGSYVFDIPADHWSSSATLDDMFGIDASYPRKAADWLQIIHPEDRESMGLYLADLLARGSRFDHEYRVVNQKSGKPLWVHGLGELERGPGGEPLRLVGTIQDVTARKTADREREALQAKLALAQRLAAMGTLVSGVAHEINNPLAAVMAAEGVALEEVRDLRSRFDGTGSPDREVERRHLDMIAEALEDSAEGSQRIADIVKDLAAFANPDPKRTRLRLPDVVSSATRWLPKALAQGADVRVENGDAPAVVACAGQIEQVVVNLVTNAVKATPPGRRGDILVRTGLGNPGMTRIEVIDHGVGIAPEIRDRIFEPFFTTRRVGAGRGAGLGLAICHAIVTDHGGTITVESEVGKGSTFTVELPAAPAEA
jgi:two-component system, NtrC family, sensor kinase